MCLPLRRRRHATGLGRQLQRFFLYRNAGRAMEAITGLRLVQVVIQYLLPADIGGVHDFAEHLADLLAVLAGPLQDRMIGHCFVTRCALASSRSASFRALWTALASHRAAQDNSPHTAIKIVKVTG